MNWQQLLNSLLSPQSASGGAGGSIPIQPGQPGYAGAGYANYPDLYQQLYGGGGQAQASGGGGFNIGSVLGGLLNPQTMAGGAALLGANALDREPGEIGEARQFLRNEFTSPNAIADRYTQQIGAFTGAYEPLLQQQEKQILDQAQHRIVAGLPASFSPSMGGGEIGAIRSAITNELVPRRQALLGDIGRQVLGMQDSAARALLESGRTDPTAAALGQLGAALLAGQGGGAGGTGGAGGGLGGLLSSLLGGGQGGGQGGAGGLQGILSSLLGGGDAGLAGPGLLGASGAGSLTALLSSLGAGAGGYGVGSLLGGKLGGATDSQGLGALGGAGGGALTGFAVGGPVGALIGGFAGALGGLSKTRKAQHAQKDAARQADLDTQARQVEGLGNFFTDALSLAGGDAGAFGQFAQQQRGAWASGAIPYSFAGMSGVADQQNAVAEVGGKLLLQAFQAKDPSIASLNQVPGLRDQYVTYLMGSAFDQPGAQYYSSVAGF